MVSAHACSRKNPLEFGRRTPFAASLVVDQGTSLADDLRLFAMFFAGGLTFMSVYLA